jgi:hypothetical protein
VFGGYGMPISEGREVMELLPRFLTTLDRSTVSLSCAHLFPHNLTESRLSEPYRAGDMTKLPNERYHHAVERILSLPLKILDLGDIWSASLLLDHSLPNTLTNLHIESFGQPLSIEQTKNLPRKLEKLYLPKFSGFSSSDCLLHLPPHLKTIRLHATSYDTRVLDPPILESKILLDDSAESSNGMDVVSKVMIPTLRDGGFWNWSSSRLTMLDFQSIAFRDPQWFSHLPHSITDLRLSILKINETWNSGGMRMQQDKNQKPQISLPSSLCELFINFNEVLPSFGIAIFLNALSSSTKKVHMAIGWRMKDCGLVNSDLQNLPQNLKKLLLPVSPMVTDQCGQFLPNRLKEFKFEEKYPSWFVEMIAHRRANWKSLADK